MAEPSNKSRVTDAFDQLAAGLEPFVDVHMRRTYKNDDWAEQFVRSSRNPDRTYSTSDPQFLFSVLIEAWDSTFSRQLPRSIKNLVFTLRDVRNDWAHGKQFKLHDAQFALSGILSLLETIDATEAEQVRIALDELNRQVHRRAREQVQANHGTSTNVLDAPARGLKPWREVIVPHPDVIAGDGSFSVAEFAADLDAVRNGRATPEYSDPPLFFQRTFLTVGLRQLLEIALRRVAGSGGQPVVNCQTNFGGGKTHSLIALYHLLSGASLASMPPELQELVRQAGLDDLPAATRAVFVGTRGQAGQAMVKLDGTKINTIWGELAWQLGGPEGYALVADSDRSKANPGDAFRAVVEAASPCLILIDEWVAYARELYGKDADAMVGGSFESQFGFAQTITEIVSSTPGALLVVSIPASEGSSSASADSVTDLEIGGTGGREALRRLTTAIARKAEHWRPASSDESFEIVRRRLFQDIPDERLHDRDAVADAFYEMYRKRRGEFPSECAEIVYSDRIRKAYPIHPEVFERLYEDWSTVEKFQRTRGVLRLMAATVSSLWDSDDRSPVIMPCSIPLADGRINTELSAKLDENWAPVIDADVDGRRSRPSEIDKQFPALGQHHATRRVARTIFFGATPTVRSANRGLEIDRVRLGSVFPGENPGFVGDALNKLAAQAPYLYVDRDRYWFDLHQNVNRTARDETARLLSGEKHEVHAEILRRLNAEREKGDFRAAHVVAGPGDEVADDALCRLVILGPEHPHIAKATESAATDAARAVLERRGSAQRRFKNMLVFAAPDQRGLEALEQATAQFLAWDSISGRVDELNLDAHQRTQAANQRDGADKAIVLRLAETYQHAIVPRQDDPTGPITFDVVRLDSQGTVAQRVSRKLVNSGALATQFPPVMLRKHLNEHLARRWEDGHVQAATVWDDFARYVYLPRLRDQDVLMATVEQGPTSISWTQDGWALAAGLDESSGRYLGLIVGSYPGSISPTTLLVRPEFAVGQFEAEQAERAESEESQGSGVDERISVDGETTTDQRPRPPTVFTGRRHIDGLRSLPQFRELTEEIVQHLLASGADVEITVELRATSPDGFDDAVVRTVTENAHTLKFDQNSGFTEH